MNQNVLLYSMDYSLSVLFIILLYRFGVLFLRKRQLKDQELFIVSTVFSFIIFLFSISPVTLLQEQLFVFPLSFIYLSIVFNDNKSITLLVSLTYIIILVVLSVCSILVTLNYFELGISHFYSHGLERTYSLLISRGMMLIGIELFSRASKKRSLNPFQTSTRVIWFFVLSFLLVAFLFESFFENGGSNVYNTMPYMVAIFVSFITISLILTSTFIRSKAKLIETQDLLEEAHFKQLASSTTLEHYLNVMHTKHDLKNHLIVVRYFIEAGMIDDALQYLQSLQSLDAFKVYIDTKNDILNAIINAKISNNLDITFKVDIKIDQFSFKPLYIATIIGNALDNAIEAVKLLEDRERTVEIVIQENEQYGKISISNPYNGSLNVVDGFFNSTKRESGHGIGMSSIAKVVDTLDGKMEISTENGQFRLNVLLKK